MIETTRAVQPVPRYHLRSMAIPKWTKAALGAILFTGALAVAAWNISLPFYSFSAGPIGDVVDALLIEDATVYPPNGELYMLTVALQEVNVYEMVAAATDPYVDLVARTAVRPEGQSDEDFREAGLTAMDEAKATAVAVALDELGYKVALTGDGVEVAGLVEGTPAGSVLQVGDVITAVNGVEVNLAPDLTNLLSSLNIGDRVSISLERAGSTETVEVTLVEHTEQPGRPMVGFLATTRNLHTLAPPFDIEIDTSNIGGPSAGMMYTLAIIDVLSEGDLTAGHVVAGTGTISSDGSVGEIGGVRQKVVAAQAAGAEFVLVPAGNYQEALTAKIDSIEIVPVADLGQALAFLRQLPAA